MRNTGRALEREENVPHPSLTESESAESEVLRRLFKKRSNSPGASVHQPDVGTSAAQHVPGFRVWGLSWAWIRLGALIHQVLGGAGACISSKLPGGAKVADAQCAISGRVPTHPSPLSYWFRYMLQGAPCTLAALPYSTLPPVSRGLGLAFTKALLFSGSNPPLRAPNSPLQAFCQ